MADRQGRWMCATVPGENAGRLSGSHRRLSFAGG
jgi:hypothetical protein